MNNDEYSRWANRATDWSQRYLDTLRDRPVRASLRPGDFAAQLPEIAPENPEDMAEIFADFERLVPDAMTHWQHPRFFAYFPTNGSVPAMVAEQLVTTLSAQCMLWQTSPAATELEGVIIRWLRGALGLPAHFTGVLHDTATTATLSAVLTMRERALDWQGLENGIYGARLRIYASAQTHSSVDKAVRLAGIGQNNLVRVATDADYAMDINALRDAIAEDRAMGFRPAGVIACVGGTSIGAMDRVDAVLKVARAEDLYSHVDAAWAGSAMICPEFRPLWQGAETADSIVFNPYKWLGALSDCSVQFLADPVPQIRTLGLRPAYLETLGEDEVTNYNEWTIPLGRRFKALKLWFLLRAYGLEGLRQRIRNHVAWVQELETKFADHPDFTITTRSRLALFSFQFSPAGRDADAMSENLLRAINDDGRVYLTQTRHEGRFVIRMNAGQFDCTRDDVMMVYDVACELAAGLTG